MKTPRVYIIQPSKPKSDGWTPDIKPATEFGRIEFIFDGGDRAYSDPRAALKKIQSKLADFDEHADSILPWGFGDPMCIWLLFYWFGHRQMKPYVLYWSRGRGENGEMSNEKGFYIRLAFDSVADYLLQYEKDKNENSNKVETEATATIFPVT